MAPRTSPTTSPRTILYTGKGGVGKTSVAAATARRCAAQGLSCVVLSTDPAHSLSDSLGLELGPEPTPAGENLWGQEVHARREMERNWGRVRAWLMELLAGQEVAEVSAEELTVPPGMDELFSLLQIKRHHEERRFDVVIVDCAPTGETLRLLGFPEIARWWLEKFFPNESRLMGAARPIARTLLDIELPGPEVLGEVRALSEQLIAMNSILRDHASTSIRLVMNPEEMVVREARRTFTYLNLYGYLTDAVIVNRVFPEEVEGGYFERWRELQRAAVTEIEASFSPVPALTARYFEREVAGAEMLDRLGSELFDGRRADELMHTELAHEIAARDGRAVIKLQVPFAQREEISLKKIGDELVVTAGRERRTMFLPAHLASRRPAGAQLVDGVLEIAFEEAEDATPGGAVGQNQHESEDGPLRAARPADAEPAPRRRSGAA